SGASAACAGATALPIRVSAATATNAFSALAGRTLRTDFTVFLSAVLMSVLTFDRGPTGGEQDPLPVPAAQTPVLDVFGADRTHRVQELRSAREGRLAPDVLGQGRTGPVRVLHPRIASGEADRGVIALEIHVIQDVLAAVGGVELEVTDGEDVPVGAADATARCTLQIEAVGQCQLEQ